MEKRGIFEDIKKIENKLDLPKDFFLKLLEENDWSFIIKLHALFEGSVTFILNEKIGLLSIKDIIARLEFGNEKRGKIALLSSLKVISKDQINFIKFISEIRNRLVHNVIQVSFSFDKYISDLNKSDKDKFYKSIGYGLEDEFEMFGKTYKKKEFLEMNCMLWIWMRSADIIACLYLEKDVIELESMKKQFYSMKEYFNTKKNS